MKMSSGPVTILDLAVYRGAVADSEGRYAADELDRVGLAVSGGCVVCGATLGAGNACPSRSGYWKCLHDCIGDDGYETAEEANADIFGGAVFLENLPRKERATPRWLYRVGEDAPIAPRFVVTDVPEVGALAFPAHPGGDVSGALAAGGDGATLEGVLADLACVSQGGSPCA